jgi:cob(I)alamin adenosyltransferase
MKIYTKTGDDGLTSLLGGERFAKDDIRVDAYGAVDSLNSHIGYLRTLLQNESSKFRDLDLFLEKIQTWAFSLGAVLASAPEDRAKYKISEVSSSWVHEVEQWIDKQQSELTPLKNFILPGGTKSQSGSYFHIVRCECRLVERKISKLRNTHPDWISATPLILINRLSDFFFTSARWTLYTLGHEETLWKNS